MPNIPELKSKILSFIQRNGPSIPVHISKEIRENMIFTGAVLSELISNKKLLVSAAKIGSSPVYYIQGQEYKLSQVLHPHMKDVYKRVHDLLKEKIILRDNELEPWQRVALRELKDFAIMLMLSNDGEIFWKWHLTSDEAAELLIKKQLGFIQEEKPEQLKEKTLETFEKKTPESPNMNPTEKDVEKIEEAVEKITGIKPLPKEHKYSTKRVLEKRPKEEKPKEEQQILTKELDLGELSNFFKTKKITISSQKQIGKKEINFTGEVSSNLGLMKIFVKFKDKKKISDSDFITAHNEAGRMTLYFISSGELTKKAEDYIKNNFLIYEKLK